jgi:TonB-dependent receptor
MRQYFDQINGSNNPNLFNQFYTFNFAQVRQLAATASGLPALYLPKTTFDNDARTEEKSKNAYIQFGTDWDTKLPIHTALGLRYEKTDVTSTALVPAATSITWVSQNELPVQFGDPTFTTLTGNYHNLLPSFDSDIELTADQKLRFSYGQTIGRPRYDQIQGGTTLNGLARVDGGTGSQGNPALKPVKSKNLDLSYEWYYGKQNFFSLGYFKQGPGQLRRPVDVQRHAVQPAHAGRRRAVERGAGQGLHGGRHHLYPQLHLPQPPDRPWRDPRTGRPASGNATGNIVGQPGDPVANFKINSFANQKSASLNGVEVNLQHMFGSSGFGVSTNYTYVHSGLKYDNAKIGEQFALVGLSNSSNVVGIYEDKKWTARVAYNWRGEFLSSTFDGLWS